MSLCIYLLYIGGYLGRNDDGIWKCRPGGMSISIGLWARSESKMTLHQFSTQYPLAQPGSPKTHALIGLPTSAHRALRKQAGHIETPSIRALIQKPSSS